MDKLSNNNKRRLIAQFKVQTHTAQKVSVKYFVLVNFFGFFYLSLTLDDMSFFHFSSPDEKFQLICNKLMFFEENFKCFSMTP